MSVAARIRSIAALSSVRTGSAMLVMGSWAAYANRGHGWPAALTAGVVQAGASALLTASLEAAIERMSGQLEGFARYLLPPSVACTAVLALLLTAHRIAGTRELLHTIALPFAASTAYAWIYAAMLARRSTRPLDRQAQMAHTRTRAA